MEFSGHKNDYEWDFKIKKKSNFNDKQFFRRYQVIG